MKRDVAHFVSQCDVCRTVKAEHQRLAGLLQPLEVLEWKWDHIEMDFVTGFPRSQRGNNAIFVIVDNLSKICPLLACERVYFSCAVGGVIHRKDCFPCMVFQRNKL